MALADAPREPDELARHVAFAPLGPRGAVEQAVRRLGEAIGVGILPVGERLPPEAELAVRFGIAPMSLREALATLRAAGYVETRRGRGGGTFVRCAVPPAPIDGDSGLLVSFSPPRLHDLYDFRAAVEGAAGELAAARASAADIEELRDLAAELVHTAQHPYDAYRLLDAQFHIRVATASRSLRLTIAVTDLQAELRGLFAYVPAPPRALRPLSGQHAEIAEAIAARDGVLARALLTAHAIGSRDLLIGLRLGAGDERSAEG